MHLFKTVFATSRRFFNFNIIPGHITEALTRQCGKISRLLWLNRWKIFAGGSNAGSGRPLAWLFGLAAVPQLSGLSHFQEALSQPLPPTEDLWYNVPAGLRDFGAWHYPQDSPDIRQFCDGYQQHVGRLQRSLSHYGFALPAFLGRDDVVYANISTPPSPGGLPCCFASSTTTRPTATPARCTAYILAHPMSAHLKI